MTNRFKGILDGAGFYAALSVCILAAGVAGYFLLLKEEDAVIDEEEPLQAAELPVLEETPLEVTLPIEAEPVPEEPAEEIAAAAMPEISAPVLEEVYVAPAAPQLVVQPLRGEVVAAFSVDALLYSETMGDWRTHDGVDIAAQAGSHVLSASAGTVLAVEQDPLMGTTVTISHPDGYQTTYANLQARPTVEVGDSVTAGQVIGAVGTTAAAESAQGPHLHFSVAKDGDAVDPDQYLNR